MQNTQLQHLGLELVLDNMLKKSIISFLCIFLTCSIQAQNFGGGIILGISSSQVSGDNLSGFNKAGLLIGVFANRSISEILSLQMEMNYIQKGSDNADINDYQHKNRGVADISLSYIEVPLLLKYNQSNKLEIEAGLQTGHLINGYYNDNYGKIDYNVPPFSKYDIGLLLGINYKYSDNISINTRLSNSILPIGSEDYDNSGSFNSSIKGKYNSVLSFTLYYKF